MVDETGKIMRRQQLDNGMEIVFYDRSRIMAGDRWIVELHCEAFIPIADSYWDSELQEDPQVLAGIRKILGNRLVQTFSKRRNFIDGEQRESILQEMVQQVHSGILEYLKRPNFPMRLFKKHYRDARQKVIVQEAMSRLAND